MCVCHEGFNAGWSLWAGVEINSASELSLPPALLVHPILTLVAFKVFPSRQITMTSLTRK